MRIAVLGVVAAALLGMGLIHVPAVRRIAFPAEKCPRLGPGSALEDARRAALQSFAGTAKAPSRSAFGLALGQDRKDVVRKWASEHALSCTDVDGVALRCDRQTTLFGFPSDLFLRFDVDRLVGLDAVSSVSDAGGAKTSYVALRDALTKSFGAPHEQTEADAGRLATRWKYADLIVDLSAFFLSDGARLRLQVRSIP